MNARLKITPSKVTKMSHWSYLKTLAVSTGMMGLMVANPVLAQEKMMKTITVTGRGTERVATTLTQVRLGVEAQGKTANDVQQEVARRSNSVVSLLKSRQVERLETTGISLNPTYRYDNGTQILTGYSASNMVSFRIATEKAGTLLDDAVKAGASRIDGISFIAGDEAIASAQKNALRKATQDARSQADAVLGSLGLAPAEVVNIQVNGSFAPPPRPLYAEAMMAKAAAPAPTPIVGGEQQVEASVTLQISYK
jgi:uncharacterized protein YggE